jgi:hypothetical protein
MKWYRASLLVVIAIFLAVAVLVSPTYMNLTAQGTLVPRAYLPIIHSCSHWRPFSDASPWNTPIGPNPEIDPNSAAMIATLLDPLEEYEGFWINEDYYAVPIYYADANTPTYDVECVWPSSSCEGVPIPNGAMPDPTEDGHMAVVDLFRGLSWDIDQAKQAGSRWQAWSVTIFDLTSSGVLPDGTGSAIASGFPLVSGIIRLDEVRCGHIDHALWFAYKTPRAKVYVYPASITFDDIGGPNTIPMGGRIQLDPTLNLDTLGLSPGGKVVARALQKYGAYLGIAGNSRAFFAEGLYGKPGQSWSGILDSHDLQKLSSRRYRVLKLPPLKYMPGAQ